MKDVLLPLLRHVRADVDETVSAIENDKIHVALAKLDLVQARIRDAVTELQS